MKEVAKDFDLRKMQDLREALQKKTREDMAYLIGVGYINCLRKLGYEMKTSEIYKYADLALNGGTFFKKLTKKRMIKQILKEVRYENLKVEQIYKQAEIHDLRLS